ncbi:MAG TPA: peroxiredoxin [Candidatus Saccharimonadales bacterium]|nr:peroxiredoxin [Candidatus Saccharimonadales bacterium]
MNKAPDFTLPDQNGTDHSLGDYAGKWLVLYFYPADDTPGCTTEACSFRDEREVIAEHGAEVVGVSKDTVASHKKFAEKYGLTFTVLSDPEHVVIEAYGAWAPKKMFGRDYLGTLRKTFIIDPAGNIAREFPNVSPKGHALEIIRALDELKQRAA